MIESPLCRRWRGLFLLCVSIVVLFAVNQPAQAAQREFRVTFDPNVRAEPFTGRVYLFFTRGSAEPRRGPNWFRPEPFLSQDVTGLRPGEVVTFSTASDGILAYPEPLKELDLAGYKVQAVMRFNPYDCNVGTGVGNGYSAVVDVSAGDSSTPLELTVDRLVPPRKFQETRWTKLLKVRSKRLSEFHGRDVYLEGAVRLPASYYDEPERRYPTIFIVPGFSGTHFDAVADEPVAEKNKGGVEFLRVTLDPSCPLGHHTFADSANNGPVGEALIRELIPAYDRQFRSIPEPSARFLTGHSSGGWSTLWLQVTYPDQFGGTWSTAPDPVDFRDFQQINMYRPGESMYVDAEGNRRPLARMQGRVVLWYREFDRMEWTLGHGGQLHSFEAVFSPRGADGKPLLAWDRKTGTVNTEVTRAWEDYDIRLILERHWDALGPKLAGKIHVFMGDADTFYLEGATIRLKETLAELGSDAVVEIHSGRDHFDLLTPELRSRIRSEMVEAFLIRPDSGAGQ